MANATYTINPLGQRIRKSVTQSGVTTVTTFVYDEAGHLVAENDSAGNSVEYIWLGDMPVAVNKANTQVTQGTAIVVDPGTAGSALNGSWSSSALSNNYGSSSLWKATIQGAPQGIMVDEDNTKNVSPNSASRSIDNSSLNVVDWTSLTNQSYAINQKLRGRLGQAGARQGMIVEASAATYTGSWSTTNTSLNHWGSSYKRATTTTTSPTATATWTFNIPTAGEYAIAASVAAYALASTAPTYTIQYGSTTTSITANNPASNSSGGWWSQLGVYQLPAGTLTVTLSNVASGSEVVADAISVGLTSAPVTYFNKHNWTASLPTAGEYKVYARGAVSNLSLTTAAHYKVGHAAGSTELVADQNTPLSGMWIPLGTNQFNAGLNTVSLSDISLIDKWVMADAVLFSKADAPLDYFSSTTWSPTLPSAGNYEVQAWWPSVPTLASSTVWFDVTTSSGVSRVVKDQAQQAGQWVSLGQFTLDPATAKVALLDYGVAGKRVYADAVRFIPTSTNTTSALYYVHPDHLNTPRQITTSDAANTVVWRWDSEPFGNTLPDQDPDLNSQALSYNLRFPGQYYDAETRLSYNYFRDYDPGIGRYIESDPIGLKAGLNTYGYVSASPINGVDRFGLAKVSLGGNMMSPYYAMGGGGEFGAFEITCCENKRKLKRRYAYFEAGPSVGLSAKFGPSISIDILSYGKIPTCKEPTPSLWNIQVGIISFSDGAVEVGMSMGLAARYNIVKGYRLIDSTDVGECCD